MVRCVVALLACVAADLSAAERMEAALRDGAVYIRAEFGANRYLIRKVILSSGGNGVLNFAGARIVSALSDVPFERGYLVSGEVDDVPPIKVNGLYLGGNHVMPDGASAVSSRSLEVDAGGVDLDREWRPVQALRMVERYAVGEASEPVATVAHRYTFSADGVSIVSTVMARAEIADLYVMAAQAVPLNSTGARLLQRVSGSADFADWNDITGWLAARSVPVKGLPQMAQRVTFGNLAFSLEVGLDAKTTLNGAVVDTPGIVDISAARKQYVPAYSGPAQPGDAIEVHGFRRYRP